MKPVTLFTMLMLMLTSACATSPAEPSGPNAQPSYPSSYPSEPSYPSNSSKPVQEYLPPAQPADPNNPYAPLPGDKDLQTDKVYLDSSDIQTVSTFPPEYLIVLQGSLPTPCHFLRIQIDPPDQNNNIYIKAYSVTDPNMTCAQTLQSFEATLPLKDLIPVRYAVWINGEKIAEIDG